MHISKTNLKDVRDHNTQIGKRILLLLHMLIAPLRNCAFQMSSNQTKREHCVCFGLLDRL